MSLLIKRQDRNFAFIFQVFSNQYYFFKNNTPSHSQRSGDKTNAVLVIAAVHKKYLNLRQDLRLFDQSFTEAIELADFFQNW